MRTIPLLFLITILLNLSIATLAKPAGSKESVTIEINADLLKRAKAQNINLAAILEKQLKAQLKESVGATPTSYLPFLTSVFDNFDTLMFASLKITEKTSPAEVRSVCKAINKNLDQLVTDAETRKSMPLPTSLEEAKKLDKFIQHRFKNFQTRVKKVGKKMQTSGKIMEAECADLEKDENLMQEAMKAIFAEYGPVGWCQVVRQKPQAEWTMDDAEKFTKYCTGLKPN